MDKNYELIMHVYEDSEMACTTIEELIKDLKEKDNKIKPFLEEIDKEYKSYKEEAKKILKKNKKEIPEKGLIAKMMANMGVKKEVKTDNSDSAIAELMIQGISMGSLNMEKKLSEYEKISDKGQMKIAKEFLKFQEKTIDHLKEYL